MSSDWLLTFFQFMEKICESCKNKFETKYGARIYCSEGCRLKYFAKRQCVDCGKHIPWSGKVEGILRNFKNRKRCLDCRPLYTPRQKKIKDQEKVKEKGREKSKRFYQNHILALRVKKNSHTKKRIFLALVNNCCQLCGYNKCTRNLIFHHVLDDDKLFSISSRECQYSVSRLIPEVKKCIIICHNCHGEIHDNIIDKSLINSLHSDFVSKIEKHLSV